MKPELIAAIHYSKCWERVRIKPNTSPSSSSIVTLITDDIAQIQEYFNQLIIIKSNSHSAPMESSSPYSQSKASSNIKQPSQRVLNRLECLLITLR